MIQKIPYSPDMEMKCIALYQAYRATHDTIPPMKAAVPVYLLFATVAFPDQISDRAAVESVIDALNGPTPAIPALFEAENTGEFSKLMDLDRMFLSEYKEPLSELTRPRIVANSIRLITRDVALVDAAKTQYGSVFFFRSVPVFFVLKKEGTDWKIAAVRILDTSERPHP
jgi:hypothetical protein